MQNLNFLKDRGITDILFFDYETFYSTNYTLKKMSTSMYIFDDQFLAHGVGVKLVKNGKAQPTEWIQGKGAMQRYFNAIDWSKTALVSHHLHFDSLILSHHFRHTPAYYICTLSMARPILQNILKSIGIDSIAQHYGIQGKTEGLDNTKGKRELTEEEMTDLGNYCINDVDMMYQVFYYLLVHYPVFEMDIIDWHIRMYTEGEYIVDAELADFEINRIKTEKSAMFQRAAKIFPPDISTESEAYILKALRSSATLANILEHNNVTVPTKISPTTGKTVNAFAKNDLAFMELKNDKTNPAAPLLFEARITAKSDTALNKAKLLRKFADYPPFPMYINYSRAQTMRSSGGDKLQGQNLPRGGNARKCLTAPKDHICLSIDSSGIELRVALWFAGQTDMMDKVNAGEDLYKVMASHIYEVAYDQVTKDQRSIGKVAILSLQYMAGIPTFDTMLKSGAMAAPIHLPLDEVKRIHATYRKVFDKIPLLWDKCNNFLYAMVPEIETYPSKNAKDRIEIDGHVGVEYMGVKFANRRAYTHHGMELYYPKLIANNGQFTYQANDKGRLVRKHIFSGLFTNNCIAHDTLVLTDKGWIKIQEITPTDLVHDGVEFVNQQGVQYNGVQNCLEIDNVYMTPDHKVLNNEQIWQTAQELKRPYRPNIRIADNKNLGTSQPQRTILGVFMSMWQDKNPTRQRVIPKTHQTFKLRLSNKEITKQSKTNTWYDKTSSIHSLGQYESPMSKSKCSSLEKLWGTGHNCIQTMGTQFRNLLEGYGTYIQERINTRSSRQQQILYPEKLCMDFPKGTKQQPTKQYQNTNSSRNNEFVSSSRSLQDKTDNLILSMEERENRNRIVCPGKQKEKLSQKEKVYDLINCGPRKRFVVKGKHGPLIVHNCVQHMARNIVYYQIGLLKERYKPIHTVHDEATIIVHKDEFDRAKLFAEKCFSSAPSYFKGIDLKGEVEWGFNDKGFSFYAK